MALPVIFGPQGGNINLSELDQNFAQIGLGVIYPCTAAGTNTVALTPLSGWPSFNTYTNNLTFIFNAANTSTGAVTVNVAAVGALNLYLPDGVTQAGSGSLTSGKTYVIIYVSTLNGGAGGFLIVYPSTTGLTVLRSYLAGLALSNDGSSPNTVLDVAAGQCADSTNAVMINLGAFTKSTGGSWVAGSGSNGMGQTLTIAATTWYHVFAIINGAAADMYFDTSVTAANKPTGTTAFRRIGSMLTDASSHIVAFSQNGDEFLWAVPVADVSVVNLGTTATLYTLSAPLGVKVNALFRGFCSNPSGFNMLINSPDENVSLSEAPTGNITTTESTSASRAFGPLNLRTNTSSQIRAVSNTASTTLNIATYGWVDTRGRFN